MKIILKQDVYKLGSLGDEVIVKNGYARNFLIPQGAAVPVTKANQKLIAHQRALLAQKRQAAIDEANALSKKLQSSDLVFKVKAGESGKLFGSVTTKQIIEALHEKGIDLSKKVVQLTLPIKQVGTFAVVAKLHSEVTCDFSVKVEGDTVIVPKETTEEVEATEAPAEETPTEESAE